jgi:hypothetical protein
MSKNQIKTACVLMTGLDVQMDLLGNGHDPANPLPAICSHCTFPDLDFIAKPYLLTKGISSPAETSPARMGNFLVRERVRRILELVAPEACTFHPTAERKSKKPAPWWLAVPSRKLETPAYGKAVPPFCPQCREPRVWCYTAAEVWARMNHFDSAGVDIFKTTIWHSHGGTAEDDYESINRHRKESGLPPLPWAYFGIQAPPHPERWTRCGLNRDLYFSVRLEQLFKRAKVKGQLVRLFYFKDVNTLPEDEAWIADKLKFLAEHGLVDAPKPAAGKPASAAQKWFKQFLKKNAAKKTKPADFAAVEKKHKLALPPDYKDFIAAVGEKSFADVNELEGSTTTILPPEQLDFKDYRRGKVPDLEGEDAEVDGVMFAATDFGDCFVFDVSAKGSDYPVYWYRHEENTLEQFAPNFAECIKRFAQKN